jgi:Family of unknown function (DUF6328)
MGVQVIFGFLLAVPFTARFVTLSHTQRMLCLTSLTLAALATALLLGPIAYHRLNLRCMGDVISGYWVLSDVRRLASGKAFGAVG